MQTFFEPLLYERLSQHSIRDAVVRSTITISFYGLFCAACAAVSRAVCHDILIRVSVGLATKCIRLQELEHKLLHKTFQHSLQSE